MTFKSELKEEPAPNSHWNLLLQAMLCSAFLFPPPPPTQLWSTGTSLKTPQRFGYNRGATPMAEHSKTALREQRYLAVRNRHLPAHTAPGPARQGGGARRRGAGAAAQPKGHRDSIRDSPRRQQLQGEFHSLSVPRAPLSQSSAVQRGLAFELHCFDLCVSALPP